MMSFRTPGVRVPQVEYHCSMWPEGSLLFSQEFSIGPYPEPDYSSPQPLIHENLKSNSYV
jgi:hypothetical protein